MGGLPLLVAATSSDLDWNGPTFLDDRGCFVSGNGPAVDVADHVWRRAVHDSPGAFGEVGGHDA